MLSGKSRNIIEITREMCENITKGQECSEREYCTRPHSMEEQAVWQACHDNKSSKRALLEDFRMCGLDLRAFLNTTVIPVGSLLAACPLCYKRGDFEWMEKKKNQPTCQNITQPHDWNVEKCLLLFQEISSSGEPGRLHEAETLNGRFQKVSEQLKIFRKRGFSQIDIVSLFNKIKRETQQTSKSTQRKHDDGNKNEFDDDFDLVWSNKDVDCPTGDDANTIRYAEENQAYYNQLFKTREEAKENLEKEPTQFKLCTIKLIGSPVSSVRSDRDEGKD